LHSGFRHIFPEKSRHSRTLAGAAAVPGTARRRWRATPPELTEEEEEEEAAESDLAS
jgi:hypothetical protein